MTSGMPPRLWPRPFRKMTASVLRPMADEEFFLLCRLVHKRIRKHHGNDRHADNLVRRLKRRRYGLKLLHEKLDIKRQHPYLLFYQYKDNAILNNFLPRRKFLWKKPIERKETRNFILKNFSFVDDPNATMNLLQEIASAECTTLAARLDFADALILDIGPYMVWGLMSDGMAPFLVGGKMNPSIQKVIQAVKLRTFMGMKKFKAMSEYKAMSDYKDVWAFPLRERHSGPLTAIPELAIGFSKVADEFVDTIDEWLGALPKAFELKENARPGVNKIVTEILENAERHGHTGKDDGKWYVAGFMARRLVQDRVWHDCHVAFVNLGDTISDNMQKYAPERVKRDLQSYIQKHRSEYRSAEALATLYAMQDGVSSLPEGAGGKGMMDMVELTNRLGHTNDRAHQPAITVISGRSCIRFRGRYSGCFRLPPDHPNRVQPFNPEKKFDSPPDPRYVYDLDHAFPGTIVALRFSLDHEALEPLTDGRRHN